jgi:hypothetical protein
MPIVVEMDRVGRVVLTRVLGRDGRERMELTGSAYLSDSEPAARRQLQRTLTGLARLLQRAAVDAGVG